MGGSSSQPEPPPEPEETKAPEAEAPLPAPDAPPPKAAGGEAKPPLHGGGDEIAGEGAVPAPGAVDPETGDSKPRAPEEVDVLLTSPAAAAPAAPAPAAGSGDVPAAVRADRDPERCKLKVTDFTMIKTIGQGSFGTVLQVRKNDDGKIYAMKVLKKERVIKRRQVDHTLSERRILENIDHPFIVSLRYAFQTEHKLYMVFDFFNGGELFNYLSTGGAFSEDRARFYAAEILCGLEYLHERGIVYRDLKAENIVLDSSGHVRITDFGLAKDGVEGDSIKSICGTPEYLAPEVIRRRPYGAAVDWWSLGTLLYEMLAGFPPYYDRNRQVMYRKILTAELSPPDDMKPEAADLCRRMLAREPTERLGYHGAADIKGHPFFASIDWDALVRKEMTPPWTPKVSSHEDVSLISPQWTQQEPRMTASPEGVTLRDAMGVHQTPPSFGGFTFVHEGVFGATYRVSISSSEDELEANSDRDSGAW